MALNMTKVLIVISTMMNKEYDEHADLIRKIEEKLGSANSSDLLKDLSLVHNSRIKTLEEALAKIKEIK